MELEIILNAVVFSIAIIVVSVGAWIILHLFGNSLIYMKYHARIGAKFLGTTPGAYLIADKWCGIMTDNIWVTSIAPLFGTVLVIVFVISVVAKNDFKALEEADNNKENNS